MYNLIQHDITTGWGVSQQSRLGLNWNSISYHDHFAYENVWLRMVKSGNTITSYVKNKDDYDYLQFNSVDVRFFVVGVKVSMGSSLMTNTPSLPNLNTYIG